MKVPIIDLVASYNEQKDALLEAASDVLSSGYYVSGPRVEKLEKRIAEYCGVKSAVGCASGTDALRLSLQAFDIQEGDEIITPVFTFFACSSTIALNGATPVFVDIDPYDFNLDINDIKKRLTSKTQGIIVVHLYGHPANMDEILQLAKDNNLFVIEDCAQAIGAEYKSRKVGSMGDLGTFSFYPTKNLHACGEGGMIIGSNPELIDKIKLLRNHGENPRYHHNLLGVNSRLDEIQAAFIDIKLNLLDKWNDRRCRIAAMYNDGLSDLPLVLPPKPDENVSPVYHTYTIRADRRDDLIETLRSNDIGVMLYYPVPMHLQPVFKHLNYKKGNYPNAEKACGEVLSIPIHQYLADEQVEFVIETIQGFFSG
ncbi:DegT/DnrJ/EryC1/StrS family aminotransferase [bacterium]|nr:DegT/DnrJ/EryC1/StrS family aminotransferase [bacterium]